ncbi:MAG: hypothetical protein VR75_03710 [Hyphomonadaceae bacterium BRH_c29]|nr:MAG: hypothetical protein VR75_03710 [Hyphomonadaceae bacterium BRH_c29]HAY05799.1 hypothetical protein [Hyphomonas sp.]
MRFTERFRPFVCPGDVISCEAGPFTVLAQVVADDCPDAPDQRQDGFWPSLYIDAPGFIGPGNNFRQRFAEAQAKAEAVMDGWRKGDWFYCGIVLSVSLEGVDLARTGAALFGIEANYPGTDNSYLTDVANELLPESMAVARETLVRLAAQAQAMEGA